MMSFEGVQAHIEVSGERRRTTNTESRIVHGQAYSAFQKGAVASVTKNSLTSPGKLLGRFQHVEEAQHYLPKLRWTSFLDIMEPRLCKSPELLITIPVSSPSHIHPVWASCVFSFAASLSSILISNLLPFVYGFTRTEKLKSSHVGAALSPSSMGARKRDHERKIEGLCITIIIDSDWHANSPRSTALAVAASRA